MTHVDANYTVVEIKNKWYIRTQYPSTARSATISEFAKVFERGQIVFGSFFSATSFNTFGEAIDTFRYWQFCKDVDSGTIKPTQEYIVS